MVEDNLQQQIVEDARKYANEELRPNAAKIDQKGAFPKKLIRAMAEKRYLSASFPKEFGGLGLDPVYYGKFTEEIGKACSATRSLLTVQTSLVGESLLRVGNKQQKEKWLPFIAEGKKIGAFALTEPHIGSDAKNIQCRYKKKDNTYILNGRKKWISFGAIAAFFIVLAQCDGKISAFIVERSYKGISSKPIKGLLAGRASHIAELEFIDVKVPDENLLGPEGGGFSYVVGTALDHGRYSIAWAGIAIAQASLEAMVAYSRKREQFGQKIHKFQLIQAIIGDAVTNTHAARALCLRAGDLRKKNQPEAVTETTIAKYFSSKVAAEISSDAVQVHGGQGCCDECSVERLFREAKVLEIIEGTSQIQQIIIAKYGLRKYHRTLPEY